MSRYVAHCATHLGRKVLRLFGHKAARICVLLGPTEQVVYGACGTKKQKNACCCLLPCQHRFRGTAQQLSCNVSPRGRLPRITVRLELEVAILQSPQTHLGHPTAALQFGQIQLFQGERVPGLGFQFFNGLDNSSFFFLVIQIFHSTSFLWAVGTPSILL